jgi:hypothetical protein
MFFPSRAMRLDTSGYIALMVAVAIAIPAIIPTPNASIFIVFSPFRSGYA